MSLSIIWFIYMFQLQLCFKEKKELDIQFQYEMDLMDLISALLLLRLSPFHGEPM